MWADFSSVLSQSTRLTDVQTDRQTDGRTDTFLATSPPCIQYSAVKLVALTVLTLISRIHFRGVRVSTTNAHI